MALLRISHSLDHHRESASIIRWCKKETKDRQLAGDCRAWQLVRASTAAPTYFPPEVIQVGGRDFIFVDGGVTMYNNPAFELFLMATTDPYNLCWPTGENEMFLVSVGTGTSTAKKLFTFVRYNAELSREGLDRLGLTKVEPAHVQQMDSVDFIDEMQEVGRAVAQYKVKPEHFNNFAV